MFELFKNILEHLSEGIVITKPSSEILWANRAYCALTGYHLADLIGRTPLLLRGPETDAAAIERLWDTLRSAGTYKGRMVNRRADGSLFHAALSFVRIEDGLGGALFVCTMRDVSLDVEMEQRLRAASQQAEWSRDVTIAALASLAEQRDPCTGKHLQRIEAYTRLMAEWLLKKSPELFPAWARDAETISRCATLHDIGKVGIPDAILMKAGPLTTAEQRVMKDHPRLGAQIVDRVLEYQPESVFLRVARDIIACHHEAWNGTGYPNQLAGSEIPLVAQLTTVADVFDALTSVRPYKQAHRFEDAVEWIRGQNEKLLGPLAVEAFMARLDDVARVHAELGEPTTDTPINPSGMAATLRLDVVSEPPRPSPFAAGKDIISGALEEGLASTAGGEVVVRSGDTVGRIYVHEGAIVWVHNSASAEVLTDVLRQERGMSTKELADVIEECKRSGLNFAETLVELRLISRPRLRHLICMFLSRRLNELLVLPQPGAMFIPQARAYTNEWTFSIEELLSCQAESPLHVRAAG